jgi:hypothetical protein
MNQQVLNATENRLDHSSMSAWAKVSLAAVAFAMVASFFSGMNDLSPSTRASITDYIVAIGATELH